MNINSERLLQALPHTLKGRRVTGVRDLEISPGAQGAKMVIAWWDAEKIPLEIDHPWLDFNDNLRPWTAQAVWHLPSKCDLATCHYPKKPILPGVSILDMMTRVWTETVTKDASFLKWLSIEKAKFRRSISPNDIVRIRVKRISRRVGEYYLHGEAIIDKTTAVEVVFSLLNDYEESLQMIPDSAILESIAQAGSILGYHYFGSNVVLKLIGMQNVQFKNTAYVGNRIDLIVHLTGVRKAWIFLQGEAFIGDHLIASMEFSAIAEKIA